MEISENIRFITEDPAQWRLFRNRSYQAMIEKADRSKIYNVPDQKGVVYNVLEDAYAMVTEDGYVVTGLYGEKWPIGKGTIVKYDIAPEDVTDIPTPVMTVELETVYAGIRIDAEIPFTLVTDYGERVELKGNREGIVHGDGDWILVAVCEENGRLCPDFSDMGRVVNGSIFHKLYREIGT